MNKDDHSSCRRIVLACAVLPSEHLGNRSWIQNNKWPNKEQQTLALALVSRHYFAIEHEHWSPWFTKNLHSMPAGFKWSHWCFRQHVTWLVVTLWSLQLMDAISFLGMGLHEPPTTWVRAVYWKYNTRTRSYKENDLQELSMCPMSMMVAMEVWPKTKESQSETTQEDTRAPGTLNSISSQLRMVERYKRNIVVERRWPLVCFSNCFSLLGMAIVLRKDNHKALQLLDISIKPDFSASPRGNCGTECQGHWQIWMDSSGQHPRNNFTARLHISVHWLHVLAITAT